SQTNTTPILLGEFGADNEGGYNYSSQTYGNFGGPENTSRVEFHKYLSQKAIDLGFAFTAWDAGDKANKTIYKVSDRSWVEDVKDALLGTTLSIDSFESNNNIRVFPNPATSFIELKTTQIIDSIELYDINGRIIPLNYIKNNSKIILPTITNGMYILKAIHENGEYSNHKILINN
ncbi:T9SS type A sorting domain-containing protein, partial [Algibacter sp.]|nr:T9SS type A sorting domain-containing protein [Algibacter sp.]